MAEYIQTEGMPTTGRDKSRAALGARAVVTLSCERVALAGIILVSLALEVFRLNQEGYDNTYYAAAVKSMMQS